MATKMSDFMINKKKYECYCHNLEQTPCFRVYSKVPEQNQKWYMRYYYVRKGDIQMREIYANSKEEIWDKFNKLLKPLVHKFEQTEPQYTKEDLTRILIRLNKLRIQLTFPIKVEHDKTYYTGGSGFRNAELAKLNLNKIDTKERTIIKKIIELEKEYINIKQYLSKKFIDLELDNL